jgi:hypothetical protein
MSRSTPDPSTPRRRALVLAAMFLALGAAWAASERWLAPQLAGEATADGAATESVPAAGGDGSPAAGEDAAAAGDAGAGNEAPVAGVDEITDAEIRKQIEAVEAATRAPDPDSREKAADRPLPADLGIALPSDI